MIVPRVRLDVAELRRAISDLREQRSLSWRQVAAEVGISPSTLTRMAEGKKPDADALCALMRWLGQDNLAAFWRVPGGLCAHCGGSGIEPCDESAINRPPTERRAAEEETR